MSASGVDRQRVDATLKADGRTTELSLDYAISSNAELEGRFKGCGLKNPRVDFGTASVAGGEIVHRVSATELLKRIDKGRSRWKSKLEVEGSNGGTAEITIDKEIEAERLLRTLYQPTRTGKAVSWAAARGPNSAILTFLGTSEIIPPNGEIAFVAWVEDGKETPAGTCQFEGPSGFVTLDRKRVDTVVKVVEARTGAILTERTFPGFTVPCPKSIEARASDTTNTRLHGSVSYDTIRVWLATLNIH